ncbi:MAG: hypothetical protein AABY14_04965 [Nanoarchaeota archaeon]
MEQIIKRLPDEKSVIKYINKLANETEFIRGEILPKKYRYVYLIEGLESICIEDVVYQENGDWDEMEYLNGIVRKKHFEILKTDFEEIYQNFDVIINEIRDALQYGLSVILIRLPKKFKLKFQNITT